MPAKKSKSGSVHKTSKVKEDKSHQYETMSQVQNRYQKGRTRNGSDGGNNLARGSNH
jgi:hypothetical protein